MKRIGVVRFPGTNCDYDVFHAVNTVAKAHWLWHEDQFDSRDYDGLVIPGGFSYGDYLRCGALAARSPVMKSVQEAAKSGRPILGICNGFQILCEAQLLPGVLTRNESQRFIDTWVELEMSCHSGVWSNIQGRLTLPIAHGEGRFYADENTLNRIEESQLLCRYIQTPNGSLRAIAGVTNKEGNVAALMPHPERAMQSWMGGTDGRRFFEVLAC